LHVRLPLGVSYLASSLISHSYECDILDLNTCIPKKRKEIFLTYAKNYDYVGFSFLTPAYPAVIELASLCKNFFPNIKIIFGGPHASFTYHEILKHDFVDYVIIGEGEKSLVELVSHKKLRKIPGLAYKNKRQIIVNKPIFPDLNSLSFPVREKCIPIHYKYSPIFDIIITRGCNGRCTFCVEPCLFGHTVRTRDLTNFINELKLADDKKYHKADIIGNIYFSNTFFKNFCTEMKKVKINIPLAVNLHIDYMNRTKLKMLKEIGVKEICFGVETLQIPALVYIQKTTNPTRYIKNVFKILKYCKEIGIKVWTPYILGIPGQKKKDTIKDISLLKNNGKISLAILTPYPGTIEWQRLSDKLITHNLEIFDAHHIVHNTIMNDDFYDIDRFTYNLLTRIKSSVRLLFFGYV
jgi:radical SAM superfamily enzyme YgiQ (UPF0313 family)